MNRFGICHKCKAVDYKILENKLKQIDCNAFIDIRCHNICGIGRTKPFVIVNHIPVIADNIDDLLVKVSEMIEKEDK